MFPLMRTLSTTNTQHPSSTPQPNKFPQMRTSSTPNTQHPSPVKHVPPDAHIINTQHSIPITRQTCSLKCALHQYLTLNTYHPTNKFPQMRISSTPITQHPSLVNHVPSDAHFINTQHSTPITQQTCSLRCAFHQHPSLNTQHPKFNTQHPSKAPHTLRDNNLHQSANTTG